MFAAAGEWGLVYTLDPVDRSHPLAQGRVWWAYGLPPIDGGGSIYDLASGSLENAATISSGLSWTPTPYGSGWVQNRSGHAQATVSSSTTDFGFALWASPTQTLLCVALSYGIFYLGVTSGNVVVSQSNPANDMIGPSYASGLGGWRRVMGVLVGGTTLYAYCDGVRYSSTTASISARASNTLYIGKHPNGFNWPGYTADPAVYDLTKLNLAPDDLAKLDYSASRLPPELDPRLRRLRTSVLLGAAAGGTAYTLAAAPGSFALTGRAAATVAARKLPASPGAFTLTGVAASTRASRLLAAATGAFVMAGRAAATLRSRLLAAATGAFSLTGVAAQAARGRILLAATGAYNLTGVAARALTARLLGAAAGAFALTGRAALLIQGGRHLAGGRFARPVWLRSWRYSAVISKTTLKKTVSEDRDFLFDFSRAPEILAGATVASATIAAGPGLTVGSGVVLAAALDGVAAGQGVTCEVSGGTAGTTYDVSCTATLSTGRKLVLPGTVAVFSDFGR